MYKRFWYTLMIRKTIVVVCFCAAIMLACMLTLYNPEAVGWISARSFGTHEFSLLTILASYGASVLCFLFGWGSWLLVLFFMWAAYRFATSDSLHEEWERFAGWVVLVSSCAALCSPYDLHSGFSGGLLGGVLYRGCTHLLPDRLGVLFLHLMNLCSAVVILQFDHIPFVRWLLKKAHVMGECMLTLIRRVCTLGTARLIARRGMAFGTVLWAQIKRFIRFLRRVADGTLFVEAGFMLPQDESGVVLPSDIRIKASAPAVDTQEKSNASIKRDTAPEQLTAERTPQSIGCQKAADQVQDPLDATEQKNELHEQVGQSAWKPPKQMDAPDFSFFEQEVREQPFDTTALERAADVLQQKLNHFGVKGRVANIKPGPVVTLFEYEPDITMKLNKITGLEDDLALALQTVSIRIIAPIPGTNVVGFEVANQKRVDVLFAQLACSNEFKRFSGSLPIILGHTTTGEPKIVDLAKMPHLLVAGSTGSGKSVALNTMLVSLLCSRTPKQLRLILIDPKRLEFSLFQDIGHLVFPIVSNTRQAAPVLKWVIKEMEERYEKMAQVEARNLFDFNESRSVEEQLPSIVVVIDELADLMMTAGKEIEDLITRIAQMARAAGIHMVVATQRPSVDVITGLIKVNFPSRISFRVTSKVDSRTILDTIGAEKLLGRGDMLFLHSSAAGLKRVHGAFVSNKEIMHVVSELKRCWPAQYKDLTSELAALSSRGDEEEDVLYQEVITYLEDVDEISISLLQRKFRIGYNRSARLIDLLEARGLILPTQGGRTRKVIK